MSVSNFATSLSSKLAQDFLGMQGTTRHSCSEVTSPTKKVPGPSPSTEKLCYITIGQRSASLNTARLSPPEEADVRPRPAHSHLASSACLSVFVLLEQILCCCFLTALNCFSATAPDAFSSRSISNQI